MSRIIVTNDDGINAAGIRELIKYLKHKADVYVFAPEAQNSGKGQAMNYKEGFSVKERKIDGAIKAFEVAGTPTDSAKFGIKYMKDHKLGVDFIISGINHGGNTGNSVVYSGTCGAAREGAFEGIHSIALSVLSGEAKEFEYIFSILPELMDLSKELPPSTFLNVNAPNIPHWKVKGVKVVAASPNRYGLTYDPIEEGGRFKYQITYKDYDTSDENDYAVVREGYVAVTPITTEITDHDALRKLNRMDYQGAIGVMIDLQEKLVPAMRKPEKLAANASKLLRALNRLDVPVVVTEQYAKGLGPTIEGLREAAGEKTSYLDKNSFDATKTDAFAQMMASARGSHVILFGAESHICVYLTAKSLLEQGFKVIVAKDCCASRTKESHETAMAELRAMGARVLPWESIIYDLLGDSTHPAFRTISAIVKED